MRRSRRLVLPSGAGLVAMLFAGSPSSAGSRDPMRDLLTRAEQDYRLGTANDLIERLRPLSGAGQPTSNSAATKPAVLRTPAYPAPVYLTPVRFGAAVAAQTAADVARPVAEPRALAAGLENLKPARMLTASQAVLKSVTPRLIVVAAREVEPPPRATPPVTSDPAASAPARGPPAVAGAPGADAPRAAAAATPGTPPEVRKPSAAQCRDILERAQLGVVSASEIAVLRAHCR